MLKNVLYLLLRTVAADFYWSLYVKVVEVYVGRFVGGCLSDELSNELSDEFSDE